MLKYITDMGCEKFKQNYLKNEEENEWNREKWNIAYIYEKNHKD